VTIPSVGGLVHAVQSTFGITGVCLEANFEGMMAKYDLIEMDFELACVGTFREGDLGSLELLKELSFVFEDPTTQGLEEGSCLEFFEKSIEDEKRYLKLFLEAPNDDERTPERQYGRLPPRYLPRSFTVSNACLTNSRFVWMNIYFYL